MKIQITPAASLECPHPVLLPVTNRSPHASCFSIKERERDQNLVSHLVLSSPFKSTKLLKSQPFKEFDARVQKIRPCRAILDEGFGEYQIEGSLSDDDGEFYDPLINKGRCTLSETKNSPGKDAYSFWHSQFELLEPKMLEIRPDPPDWPEKESVRWADIERKAKSFDLPLSLKMIQKRQQREGGGGFRELGELVFSSVTKAFSSMVFIIVELQSCAMQMREALCDEDLEAIISKVQRDMHSSFVWLFQQVFSRTPALMVHIMILLANFSVYSASHNFAAAAHPASLLSVQHYQADDSAMSTKHPTEASSLLLGNQEFRSATELSLWNSFLDEATKMKAGANEQVLDRDMLQRFVSPISVEVEPDNYMEYLRTNLMYQMGLSQEPNNPLLLSNYAQFLHLVAHDYDRAEECFKQAILAEPRDAESLSLYADFLWKVRKDLWRAEDAYLQALSIEPENPYYASKYASFLWNTGGEETCFPLDASSNINNRTPNL